MQKIDGLMATPTIRPAGGLQAAAPNLDMTVKKNVDDILANTTRYASLRLRQAQQAEDDMRNARALSLINEYHIYGKDVMLGDKGALYQKGTEVVGGVNGESWVSYNQGKLREKRDTILSSVEDDSKLYEKVREGLEKLDVSFYTTLDAHYGRESNQYVIDQNVQAAKNITDIIASSGVMIKDDVANAKVFLTEVAKRNGKNVNDPVFGKSFSIDFQKVMSNAAKLGVTLALDQENIGKADRLFASADQQGMVTAEDKVVIQKQIKEAKEKRWIKTEGARVSAEAIEARNKLYSASKASNLSAAKVDPALLKGVGLSDDEIAKYGKSKYATEAVNARVMGYFVQELGSIDTAIAAATVGQDAVRAAVDKANADGDVTKWMDHLSAGQKGSASAAIKRYYSDAERYTTPDENEIRARLIEANPGTDIELINKAVEQVKTDMVVKAGERDATQFIAAKDAIKTLGDGKDPEASILANLSADQRQLVSVIKNRQRQKNPGSNMDLYMMFQNPTTLKGMSDADFLLYGQAYLSPEDFAEAAKRRDNLKGVKSTDQLYVKQSDVRPIVENFMAPLNPDYNEGEDNKYVFNRTVDLVQKKVQEQAYALGRPLTKMEMEETTQSVLRSSRFFVPSGFIRSGENKQVFTLTAGDLSEFAMRFGKELAKDKYGEMFVNDSSALQAFKEYLLFPATEPSENAMRLARANYSDQIDLVKAEAKKRNIILTDSAAVRLVLLASQKDPKYFETLNSMGERKYNEADETLNVWEITGSD